MQQRSASQAVTLNSNDKAHQDSNSLSPKQLDVGCANAELLLPGAAKSQLQSMAFSRLKKLAFPQGVLLEVFAVLSPIFGDATPSGGGGGGWGGSFYGLV